MKASARGVRSSKSDRWFGSLILFFAAWYSILGYFWDVDQPQLRYFASEWMVTYSGGFVKRGLTGQALFSLSELLRINPLTMVEIARVGVQATFLILFGLLIYKSRDTLGKTSVVLLLASPFIGIYAWYFAGSLDLGFIFLTVIHLYLTDRFKGRQYFWAATLLFSTLGVITVLSHEAYLFLCLPVNLIITWRAIQERRIESILGIHGLSLLALVIAVTHKVTYEQTAQIVHAWSLKGVQMPEASVVSVLTNGISAEVKLAFQDLTPITAALWALSNLICFLPLVLWWKQVIGKVDSDTKTQLKRVRNSYILLPIICSIPIYFVGNDWHRWIAVPVSTGLLCILMELKRLPLLPAMRLTPFLGASLLVSFLTHPVTLYADHQSIGAGSVTSTFKVLARHLSHRSTHPNVVSNAP